MLNFFYYFYYRIREANNQTGPTSNQAERAAYLTIVILLIINSLSIYFLLIQTLDYSVAEQFWKDKGLNRYITLLVAAAIPLGVYWWYRFRQKQIEQILTGFKTESSDERRVGGALVMAYIFSSCGLLIFALFLPFL